jgi:hypothetical protein
MTSEARRYRRLFWLLAPIITGFVALMAVAQAGDTSWTRTGILIKFGFGSEILAMMLMLWHPDRFGWAGRVLAALEFAAYVAYFTAELLDSHGTFHFIEPRGHASRRNATIGLLVFGGPGHWFAITGRLPWQRATAVSRPDAPQA